MHRLLIDDDRAASCELDGLLVAYALWRLDEKGIHLRQFFVSRARRRSGLGRRAFTLMSERLWADSIDTPEYRPEPYVRSGARTEP